MTVVTRLFSRLAGGLAAAFVIAVPVQAQDGAQDLAIDILDKAAIRYGAVETICANFTQHLLVPLLGTERTGQGRLCQADPNLFAMRFSDPAGDLIVVDGDFAWIYFPSNDARTVLKTSAERAAGGRDFHREFLVDPEEKYVVTYEDTEVVDGHATHRLRMVPRRPMSYRHATIWVDDGQPVLRRLRFEEENGSVRTITLENLVFGADPASDWFSFTPPEGALVMVR